MPRFAKCGQRNCGGGVLLNKPFFGSCYAFFMQPSLYTKSFFCKKEERPLYKEWRRSGCGLYPYIWKKEYGSAARDVQAEIDAKNGLPYVLHGGKRLYFRRSERGGEPQAALQRAKGSYRALLIEQDERSAHRYVRSYEELKGKVLLDIGAAEAIFTLDTIEYVERAFIFECNEAWIEALQATFEPWKEKVTIVRKYVSDADDAENVALDAFFEGKSAGNLFIKMDIEGAERRALKGAQGLLKGAEAISGSVCIYHKHDDEEVITRLLSSCGLQTEVQPGYLFFEGEMRHAIVRFCR